MFAIPGIIGLLFFIYLRPQEAIERLQDIPFLYIFFALTCFGFAVDLRLRVTRAMAIPHLPWAVLFYFWCIISIGITAPEGLMRTMMLFGITVIVFILISEGVQAFRVMETIAITLAVFGLVLALIGVHQGRAEFSCVRIPDGASGNAGAIIGIPDGRSCERTYNCYENDPVPGADYWCEKVGLLGTHSVGGRVRYRGVLQDPNELSVAVSTGLAMIFALFARRRARRWFFLSIFALAISAWCIDFTQSRSGQLMLLLVIGAFLLWRYRWKAVMIGVPIAIPLLAVISAGGGRDDADESTMERYEAWRTGLDLLRESPIWGVGQGQFTKHHYLTAHNTYVLMAGELGMIGLFLFTGLIYVSIKTPIMGLVFTRDRPEARVAETWCVGILAAFAAIIAGATFLSFAYHYIMWIFIGLSGALYACIKRHDESFTVRIAFLDLVAIAAIDAILYLVLHFFLRLKGF